MADEKSIVLTVFGHGKEIDKISVTLFDKSKSEYDENHYHDSNAGKYCDTINGLELKGDAWICAKIISDNTLYAADEFIPVKFDIILKFDDRSIQRILREVDSLDIAKALKGEPESLQERLFSNMSKRAASMLKEDMEYIGPVPVNDVKMAQNKTLDIIRRLLETGEIIITDYK